MGTRPGPTSLPAPKLLLGVPGLMVLMAPPRPSRAIVIVIIIIIVIVFVVVVVAVITVVALVVRVRRFAVLCALRARADLVVQREDLLDGARLQVVAAFLRRRPFAVLESLLAGQQRDRIGARAPAGKRAAQALDEVLGLIEAVPDQPDVPPGHQGLGVDHLQVG